MKCQIMFPGKKRKHFKTSSAEIFTQSAKHYIEALSQSVADNIQIF